MGYVLNILKREQIYFGYFYFEIGHRHIQISQPNLVIAIFHSLFVYVLPLVKARTLDILFLSNHNIHKSLTKKVYLMFTLLLKARDIQKGNEI